MAHDIRPLTPDDLPALGRFLTEGFGAAADAAFASPEVLRWKYFDPTGGDGGPAPRSHLAREAGGGRVVGHVGVCPSRLRGPGLPAGGVSAVHMIDWLAAADARGVGASLMRRAHGASDAQVGLGGSAAARRVTDRSGYDLVASVPVYRKVLRLGHRLREPGRSPVGRLIRAARDAAGALARPARPPRVRVEIRPVEAFGPEVLPVLASYEARAAFTSRGPDLLNHLLRYPRGGVTGWLVVRGGAVRGLAVLSVVPRDGGATREGRVAECLLDDPDDDAWHAAISALTAELGRRGADSAVGFASAGWTARAFRRSGFAPGRGSGLGFYLRDRSKLVPPGTVYHLTPLEADYAYT